MDKDFQKCVWDFYAQHGRNLPWRETSDSYRIMVSEIMLQQTQAKRVAPKYVQFITRFPDIESLARAPLTDVLMEWQGLGYNRRGRWLHQAAVKLIESPRPWTREDFEAQKGIGYNTAAAIAVYSYNQPLVFIETNVRTVFIHHFFNDQDAIEDTALLPLVERTLDKANPREWYWALMDYGTHLKKQHKNPSRKSRHYRQQSRFEGSLRQLRSRILREILASGGLSHREVGELFEDSRSEKALHSLLKDELVVETDGLYSVPRS